MINKVEEIPFSILAPSITSLIAAGKIGFRDIFASVVKSIAYGFTVSIAGCYLGYYAKNGTVDLFKDLEDL